MTAQAYIDTILPVLEGSMILAAHYTKACGRKTVTAKDLEYALKYSAQHELGTHVGSLFPEVYDDDSSDDESIEVVDDNDEPFTRYSGDSDEWCTKMNTAFDSWESWTPFSPAEILLKHAIDQKNLG